MGRHRKNSPRKSAGVVRAKCGQQGKLSSFAEAAQELRDGRVIEETKYQYKCKIEAMKRWLDENYEEKSRVFDASGNLLTPMDIDVALNFFGYLTTKFDNIALIEEITEDYLEEAALHNIKVKGLKKSVKSRRKKVAYSFSQVRGFKSALVWYHGTDGLSDDCDKALEELLDGYKRKIASLKASGKMEIQEGKNRLLFQGFSTIGKAAMLMKPSITIAPSKHGREKLQGGQKLHPQRIGTWLQSTFAWCYFVLGWVMMCRVATTGAVLLSLMRWTGDCIRIDTAQSKTDKTGEKEKDFGRHVYANPWMPWICPFLS